MTNNLTSLVNAGRLIVSIEELIGKSSERFDFPNLHTQKYSRVVNILKGSGKK